MVLDYRDREKRGSRESAERKPVQKNRPRKEPAGMFALLAVAALILTFGSGVLTGWFVFSGGGKAAPVTAAALGPKRAEPAPAPAVVQPKPAGPEAPLTFYQTLPAGGKGTIGTGLNLKKPEPVPVAPHAAPAPVQAPAAAPSAPSAAGGDEEKQEAPARKFVVQIASYREKQEADSAQAKLSGKGAYIVESKLTDKGIWYRLRVGRHLTKAEAGELAGKFGKGAIVLPE